MYKETQADKSKAIQYAWGCLPYFATRCLPPVFEKYALRFSYFSNLVDISVSPDVDLNTDDRGVYRIWIATGLELQVVVSLPTWLLRTKPGTFVRPR